MKSSRPLYFQLVVLGKEDIVAPCVSYIKKYRLQCFLSVLLTQCSIAILFQLFLSPVSPTLVARMMKTLCKWCTHTHTHTFLIPFPAHLAGIHLHSLQKKRKKNPICILNGENILQSSQIEGGLLLAEPAINYGSILHFHRRASKSAWTAGQGGTWQQYLPIFDFLNGFSCACTIDQSPNIMSVYPEGGTEVD